MDNENTIHTIGYIKKKELVAPVKANILANTLVLESKEPFPGYHGGNLPNDSVPKYFFIVVQGFYTADRIVRSAEAMKKIIDKNFCADFGYLDIANERLFCVRVKNLGTYQEISEIQKHLQSDGVKLMKFKKVEGEGVLKVQKFYNITEIEKGVYIDNDSSTLVYLKMDYHVSSENFEEITRVVMNNVDNNNFDAAVSSIYMNCTVVDFIRIYSKAIQTINLSVLKEKYDFYTKMFVNR